ncbi:MAG: hypothetical protein IVW57_16665, partial [Ktedonobacterales bacterium]|nr:hypothetical protein [Ktedonobacterales bacterium]
MEGDERFPPLRDLPPIEYENQPAYAQPGESVYHSTREEPLEGAGAYPPAQQAQGGGAAAYPPPPAQAYPPARGAAHPPPLAHAYPPPPAQAYPVAHAQPPAPVGAYIQPPAPDPEEVADAVAGVNYRAIRYVNYTLWVIE